MVPDPLHSGHVVTVAPGGDEPPGERPAGIGGAVVGVVLLGVAVLYVALGIGLWKLLNWARILLIVLCGLGVVFNALGLLSSLVHFHPVLVFWRAIIVAVDLWIALYLLKPHVKQAFGTTGF